MYVKYIFTTASNHKIVIKKNCTVMVAISSSCSEYSNAMKRKIRTSMECAHA
jgi:hypothetical protein